MWNIGFRIAVACAFAAMTGDVFGQERIDWDRARSLRQKEVRGEQLSPEDQTYLEKAKEVLKDRKRNLPGPEAGIRGDGAGEMSFIAPVKISEEQAPFGTLRPKTTDGKAAFAVYRRPAGHQSCPAIVFVHGGLRQQSEEQLDRQLRRNPVYTRLLASGYVTVAATFRTYEDDVQSRGPILDTLAVVEAVRKLPFVDPESVVVFGGSGGGSVTLELAGFTDLSAAVCGEPATILYTGMLTTGDYRPRLEIMAKPHDYYTAETKARTLEKLKTIRCPVLMLHGDIHPLKVMNGEIMLPAMKTAGVDVDYQIYPGNEHGFYFGNNASLETVTKVIANVRGFVEPRLKVKPVQIGEK